MSQILPRIRMNLDFMPSPVEDRPGLLIRDPYGYSDATLIIPPPLVAVLELFDGSSTRLDLHQTLVQLTGDLQVSELVEHLSSTLAGAGFLEDETYERMRDVKHRSFAEAPVRKAAHAGSGYPDTEPEFRDVFESWMASDTPAPSFEKLRAIAAPHASPAAAAACYRDAYRALTPDLAERVFVILGTSHYGAPERFGLTRKDFETPLGLARTDKAMVDELTAAAPEAVTMEDYCHASEHSIEFQVAFLQHLYGASVRILPILCGSYARSIYVGGMPEDDENVRRFLGALGELNARRGNDIFWVLGIDMAHMGSRYQDRTPARAYEGSMMAVSGRDKDRIERISQGDAPGFWSLVQPNQDDLKWCGSSPIYTFLRAMPEAHGSLLRYEHWQIDPQSVVSYGALAFQA